MEGLEVGGWGSRRGCVSLSRCLAPLSLPPNALSSAFPEEGGCGVGQKGATYISPSLPWPVE